MKTKVKKMTFKDYYDSLPNPQRDFIREVAEATCSHEVTVRKWLAGDTTPPLVKQKIVSQMIGLSEDILFPIKSEA